MIIWFKLKWENFWCIHANTVTRREYVHCYPEGNFEDVTRCVKCKEQVNG